MAAVVLAEAYAFYAQAIPTDFSILLVGVAMAVITGASLMMWRWEVSSLRQERAEIATAFGDLNQILALIHADLDAWSASPAPNHSYYLRSRRSDGARC